MNFDQRVDRLIEALDRNSAAMEANGKRADEAIALKKGEPVDAKPSAAAETKAAAKSTGRKTTKTAEKAEDTYTAAQVKAAAVAYSKLDTDEASMNKRRAEMVAYAKKEHGVSKITEVPEEGYAATMAWLAERTEAYNAAPDAGDDDEDDDV